MEKYIAEKSFIQYQLWLDCSLGCKFCCNKGVKDLEKIGSLKYTLERLDDSEVLKYQEVGFIGGEFFNKEIESPCVKELFYKLFEKVSKMHFEKIYFTTALNFDLKKHFIPFVEYIKKLGILDKCLLCTSYDVAYRFHTKEQEERWKENMLFIHENYPELKLHTESILTQHFIDAVLEDKFVIKDFCEKYHTRLDYIEPASGLYYYGKEDCEKDIPGFFPTKSSFIKFIKKVYNDLDRKAFLSMELRASKLYYIDDGKRLVSRDDRRSTDGTVRPKDKEKRYEIGFIDSDKSMFEVAQQYFALVEK